MDGNPLLICFFKQAEPFSLISCRIYVSGMQKRTWGNSSKHGHAGKDLTCTIQEKQPDIINLHLKAIPSLIPLEMPPAQNCGEIP